MKEIGIIMGSDSDLKVMSQAAQILDTFNIEYELTIVSAHRTPERLFEYASLAKEKGLKLIIAGAGGAAHLPGMIASVTSLPVIGVPIKTSSLSGLDSLYSIVQMPAGVPVATMAIDGAKNAGLLAAQILGAFNPDISKKVEIYKSELNKEVVNKANNLEKAGYNQYILDNLI